MFYYLKGELVLTEPNIAVIDCGGVGYKLTISGNTLSKIASKTGTTVKLFTYLHVREDAMELYGFFDQEELSAYKLLTSVSGVGAKSAISILSLLSPEKFALAVTTGDNKSLSKASGIGAKTAARIVLELKDKIAKELSADSDSAQDISILTSFEGSKLSDAQNTLLVLGYSRSEALSALRTIDTASLELEDIIRAALKKLST